MDVKAYLASSDEECSNDEIWPDTGEGNQNLTEDANYQVRFSTKFLYTFYIQNFYVHNLQL